MPIPSELLNQWHSLEAMPCRSDEQDQELYELRLQLKAQGYDWEPPQYDWEPPQAATASKRCEHCEHFAPTLNQCRAHSPRVFPIVDAGAILWRSRWPDTLPDASCGDYTKRLTSWQPAFPDRTYTPSDEVISLVTTLAAVDLEGLSATDPWKIITEAVTAAQEICRELQP